MSGVGPGYRVDGLGGRAGCRELGSDSPERHFNRGVTPSGTVNEGMLVRSAMSIRCSDKGVPRTGTAGVSILAIACNPTCPSCGDWNVELPATRCHRGCGQGRLFRHIPRSQVRVVWCGIGQPCGAPFHRARNLGNKCARDQRLMRMILGRVER
jgi:hypothetical protein